MAQLKPIGALTIYPHRDAYNAAIKKLLADNGSVVFGHDHQPLSDLIRNIASPSEAVISRQTARILIHHLLLKQPLKFYEKIKHLPGTAELFSKTINTLKRNLITPEMLREILERRGGERENDLLTIYERYEELLESGSFGDEARLVARSIGMIKTGNVPILNSYAAVRFEGFFEMDPATIAFIDALKKAYPATTLTVPKQTDNTLYINKLSATSKVLSDVEYLCAPSLSVQALHIVRRINHLLEDGVPPDKIGLLTRDDAAVSKELLFGIRRLMAPASFKLPGLNHMILDNGFLSGLPVRAGADVFIEKIAERLQDTTGWGRSYRDSASKGLITPSLVWLDLLRKSLDEISFALALTRDTEIDREEFLNVLQMTSIKGSRDWIPSDDLPFMQLDLNRPVEYGFDQLFVPNFNAGIYPADARPQEFFTTPEFRDASDAEVLGRIFPNPEMQMEREEALFSFWLQSTKSLHVIASMYDSGGRDVPASPFTGHIKKDDHPFKPISEPPSPLNNDSLCTVAGRLQREAGILKSSPVITDEGIREDIRRRFSGNLFSVSQLESYAQCPFTYFCDKVLMFEPEEEATPEIQADDRGKIMHKVFEDFFSLYTELFMKLVADPALTGDIRTVVEHLTDIAIEDNGESLKERRANPSLMAHLRSQAIELIVRTIENEALQLATVTEPLTPAKMEWKFGFTDEPLAITPLSGNAPILIRGQIDRIDIDEENRRFLIIDYKTGEIKTVPKRIREGHHLQLPVYIEAVSQRLLKGYEPLGGILLSVRNGRRKSGFIKKEFNKQYYKIHGSNSMLCTEEDWDALKETAIEAVRRHAEGIRCGRFEPDNSDCKDYCDYIDVCRRKRRGE